MATSPDTSNNVVTIQVIQVIRNFLVMFAFSEATTVETDQNRLLSDFERSFRELLASNVSLCERMARLEQFVFASQTLSAYGAPSRVPISPDQRAIRSTNAPFSGLAVGDQACSRPSEFHVVPTSEKSSRTSINRSTERNRVADSGSAAYQPTPDLLCGSFISFAAHFETNVNLKIVLVLEKII